MAWAGGGGAESARQPSAADAARSVRLQAATRFDRPARAWRLAAPAGHSAADCSDLARDAAAEAEAEAEAFPQHRPRAA